MRAHFSWFTVFVSFLIAAILEVLDLPMPFQLYRPEWLALILIYWLLRYPEKIGMSCAVVFGAVMDLITGTPLGVYILAFSVTAYLVLNMHKRLKMFPIVQQCAVVFVLISTQLMMVSFINNLLIGTSTNLSFLWIALISAILWPLILILNDRLSHTMH